MKLKDLLNEGQLNEEPFSSPEAKKIIDQSLKEYAKLLRKAFKSQFTGAKN